MTTAIGAPHVVRSHQKWEKVRSNVGASSTVRRRDDRSIATTQGQELQSDYCALPIGGERRNAQELCSGRRAGGRPRARGILRWSSTEQPGGEPAGKGDA